MLFKYLQFIAFFASVYIPYLFLSHKWQNRLLLLASCVFYAAWDWRLIFPIFISITTDYFCGLKIYESDSEKVKRNFLVLSIFVNLSILGFFKYFNFFTTNFARLINHFGFSIHPQILNILLPIGISFYTFKTISYTIDVYAGKITPTHNYRDYALFVSFFPLILAGPIMRAKDLLSQISSPRKLKLGGFYEGCYLVFWGAFQKFFVADNLALIADRVFNSPAPYNGASVILAAYAFAFQIYCDFAGYSNMARGIGKCMGFDIMVNFNLPYFARNPQDFWNRWHISLSNWLRDYLYNPIAFNRRRWGTWGVVFALMATFILCGLWHGAAWTFVLWGVYWGLLLIFHKVLTPFCIRWVPFKKIFSKQIWFLVKIVFFFHIVCLGWILFRATSITQAYQMLNSIIFDMRIVRGLGVTVILFFVSGLAIIEAFQFIKNDLLIALKWPRLVRAFMYVLMFYSIVIFGLNDAQNFIYVQF